MSKLTTTAYKKAKSRLLLLDYDGTLMPLKSHPSLARPTPAIYALLERLTQDVRNTVVLISGRDQETMEAWFGQLHLTLVSEHGSFIKPSNEPWRVLLSHDVQWKPQVRTVMEASAAKISGSFVEEKATALVWHYRQADQQFALPEMQLLATHLEPLTKKYLLSVMHGTSIVEVRVIGVDKGAAAQFLLGGKKWGFILAAGDDTTDEDLFKSLPEAAFTIHVGKKITAARMRISSPRAFVALLRTLLEG